MATQPISPAPLPVFRKVFFLGCLCLLAACAAPPAATLAPTPQAVYVVHTPALRPWQNRLDECAAATPEIALFADEAPPASLDVSRFDVFLRLGYPAGEVSAAYVAALGEMEIRVIVNRANPLDALDAEALRAIFGGQMILWDDGSPLQPWAYPAGDDVRQGFEAALGTPLPLVPQALLAPDPAAMREAVAADPAAIGYLPAEWLGTGVRAVSLNEKLAESLRQPVLAFAAEEPQGAARDWWACLQAAGQP